MTAAHLATSGLFLAVIPLAVWAIADSFWAEWPLVLRTFGIVPGVDHRPPVDATSRPADASPRVGGATGEDR